VSLWGEDICEGPVEGISVEIVAGDAMNIVLCFCMMAVPSSLCKGSDPAMWTATCVLDIMDVGSLKYS
jgi:hypothetical protein